MPVKASPSAPSGAKGQAARHDFEFFGPHGPALLILLLPAVLYGLVAGCNAQSCLQIQLVPTFSLKVPGLPSNQPLFSTEALGIYLAWFFGMACLHMLLPGKVAQGTVLPNGKRLDYKLNGRPRGWAKSILAQHRQAHQRWRATRG